MPGMMRSIQWIIISPTYGERVKGYERTRENRSWRRDWDEDLHYAEDERRSSARLGAPGPRR